MAEYLKPVEISRVIGISRQAVSELMKKSTRIGGMREITCAFGRSKRVKREDFIQWAESRKGAKS